jgi:hypothetical protein
MSTIVTRSGKGSPLTHTEVDNNFTNLNTDKVETSGGTLTNPTINGTVTTTGLNFDSDTFVIDATNNRIGIGTSSPQQKLQINGSATITGDSTLSGATFTGVTTRYISGNNSAYIQSLDVSAGTVNGGKELSLDASQLLFRTISGSGFTERMRIDSSGNLSVSSGTITSFDTFTAFGNRIILGADYAQGGGYIDTTYTTGVGGNLVLKTVGSERMRIDSSGNVGIGTSSPSTRLEVSSGTINTNIRATNIASSFEIQSNTNDGYINLTGSGNIIFRSGTPSVSERMRIDSSGNLGLGVTPSAWGVGKAIEIGNSGSVFGDGITAGWSAGLAQNAYLSSGGTWRYRNTGISAGQYLINSNTHLWYNAASGTAGDAITFTQAMTLDASGNLGIGTTSPAVSLDVARNQNAETQIRVVNANAGSSARSAVVFGNDTSSAACGLLLNSSTNTGLSGANALNIYMGLSAPISFWTSANERMRITSNGALLLNQTANDNWALQVNNGEAHIRWNYDRGTYSQIFGFTQHSGDSGGVEIGNINNSSDRSIRFSNGSSFAGRTERMRIDSSGNLLVGTTSASNGAIANFEKTATAANQRVLHLTNNGATGVNTPAGMTIFYPNAASGNGSTYIECYDSNASRFLVLGSGNVQNTNNSYGAISDIKLKENIVDATPKLEKLNQVRVVNYNLVGETQKQIGVVAQELEQIFPSMVEESPDTDKEGNDLGTTTKSVKYSVFVPMLIKAIQEQQAIITDLKARIETLESK